MSKYDLDLGRRVGSVIYAIIGLFSPIIIIGSFGWNFMFYNEPINGFGNYPRLLWCVIWVSLGFACIAYEASKWPHHLESAFPSYYTVYLIVLLVIASAVFGFFHIFDATKNYLFYFLSGPVSFILGFHVDKIINDPFVLLKK